MAKNVSYVAALLLVFVLGAMFARSSLSAEIKFLHDETPPALVCEPPQ